MEGKTLKQAHKEKKTVFIMYYNKLYVVDKILSRRHGYV